jgi:hypothetical protein
MALTQDPFYKAALNSASRKLDKRLERKAVSSIIVRQKEIVRVAAGGNGVFVTFSSEGNNK